MNARFRRRLHAALMLLWLPQLGLVFLLPHSWQIRYLIVVSIYANFVGHWSGYSAETPVEQENADG